MKAEGGRLKGAGSGEEDEEGGGVEYLLEAVAGAEGAAEGEEGGGGEDEDEPGPDAAEEPAEGEVRDAALLRGGVVAEVGFGAGDDVAEGLIFQASVPLRQSMV